MVLRRAKSVILRSIGALGYGIVAVPNSRPSPLRRFRRIWAADHPVVHAAKQHLEQSASPANLPPLGERWGAYATRLRSRIRAVSTPEELILLGQSGEAGVEKYLGPAELTAICEATDLQMRGTLRPDLYGAFPSFRSPRVVLPGSAVEYRGRKLDSVSLTAASSILRILSLLDDRPRTVCDIGGGTGKYAMAWLVNSAHRPELVVIIDLPETLVYSETLLRTELGDDRVQYITSEDSKPNRSGIVLCPVAHVRALESISLDLVTNTSSMQEMTDAWIDWYMAWLDRQPCRLFWSENFFVNALVNMHEGHNSWSTRPSPGWEMLHSEISLGLRSSARTLFRKGSGGHALPPGERNGAEGWLERLELVRCRRNEASMQSALDFARSELPFLPKETWQVAKMLAELTGAERDRQAFRDIDRIRRTGTEALRY